MTAKHMTEIAGEILITALETKAIRLTSDTPKESAASIGEAYRIILNAVRHADRDPIRAPSQAD